MHLPTVPLPARSPLPAPWLFVLPASVLPTGAFASFFGFTSAVHHDTVMAPEGLSVELYLVFPSPTKASHQQFTQTPWSFSLTDSVPSPRSLQGRMPPLCPKSACGFVSGSQFLCASFLPPWWVAVLCSTFPVSTLVWPCPLSPSLCSLSLPSPA